MGADDLARRVAGMGAAKRKAEVDAIVAERCAPLVAALAELVALKDASQSPEGAWNYERLRGEMDAAWERARKALEAGDE